MARTQRVSEEEDSIERGRLEAERDTSNLLDSKAERITEISVDEEWDAQALASWRLLRARFLQHFQLISIHVETYPGNDGRRWLMAHAKSPRVPFAWVDLPTCPRPIHEGLVNLGKRLQEARDAAGPDRQ